MDPGQVEVGIEIPGLLKTWTQGPFALDPGPKKVDPRSDLGWICGMLGQKMSVSQGQGRSRVRSGRNGLRSRLGQGRNCKQGRTKVGVLPTPLYPHRIEFGPKSGVVSKLLLFESTGGPIFYDILKKSKVL